MKKIASSTVFNLLIPLTLGFVNAAPNIVMFLTDDQDLVLNGLEPMPKTREWFSDGQIFENAFVSTPVCCPSRSSLLTGRYQHNTKVVNNSVAGNCYGEEWRSESGLEARCVYCFQEKQARKGFRPQSAIFVIQNQFEVFYFLVLRLNCI